MDIPASQIKLDNITISDKDADYLPSTLLSHEPTEAPVCLIILGMAGSGKTTFVNKLVSYLDNTGNLPYAINLDPAVLNVPYKCNIDIRDTIKYKDVMHQYNLGPNGAIMTSLNLFTTKFDQVINIIKGKRGKFKYFIFDTPGQIEIFTWSASGTIICESLASEFTTIVVHIVDSFRIKSPITFMSNMVYACSVLYKMKLPFILALNKIDIVDPAFAIEWMQDFEKFQGAVENDPSYSANLVRSLSLVLDEFYSVIKTVTISSLTAQGFEKFIDAINAASIEYDEDYKKQYEKLKGDKMAQQNKMGKVGSTGSILKKFEVPLGTLGANNYEIERDDTSSDTDREE